MSELLLDINKTILKNRIRDIHNEKGVVYIADFDSGYITDLLINIRNLGFNIIIDSFTTKNSIQTSRGKFHNIFKRELVTCSDSSYNNMFKNKTYNKSKMVKSQQNYNKRMSNTFFEIKEGDLREHYDIVCITGPNSNGRDIAFLHMKNRLKIGSYILMNELDKYISLETMDKFYYTLEHFKNNVTIDRIGFYKITQIV